MSHENENGPDLRRRRVLALLGLAATATYVAPALTALGEAQAHSPYRHYGRYSRPSRPSRPSRMRSSRHHHHYHPHGQRQAPARVERRGSQHPSVTIKWPLW